MNVEDLVARHEQPIIGIIGATQPLEGYDSFDTHRLGYELRRLVEQKGTLFTGGVGGVGLDAYRGIVDYCQEKGVKDKFFVLFPDMKAEPPKEYFDLAKRTRNGVLNVEKVGKDMAERRVYVGAVADYLVVVNGSDGTFDEAICGLEYGKPIICLNNSGGAADVIPRLKNNPSIPQGARELVVSFDSVRDIINHLSNELSNIRGSL